MTREDSMGDVGIYILTYPGDYHLSTALVRSLQHFNPGIPIMIIPGEGVDRNDHPFDVPLMPTPGGFWGQMGHADRKFWSFQGPFKKFIYIDADIICTKSIALFVDKLKQQSGKFVYVKITIDDEKWQSAVANAGNDLHEQCTRRVQSQIGNLDLLHEFDPGFDPYAHYPFNDGLFASSRLTVEEGEFEDLYNRESAFFKKRLHKDFNWKAFDLFFGDQGRLNYLVDRLGITRSSLYPHGQYRWGGQPREYLLDRVLAGEADSGFIHWAGCPRPNPSLFCKSPLLRFLALAYPGLPEKYKLLKEIPGYSVWWHFAGSEQRKWRNPGERLKWTWRDMKLILRWNLRKIVRSLRAKSGR